MAQRESLLICDLEYSYIEGRGLTKPLGAVSPFSPLFITFRPISLHPRVLPYPSPFVLTLPLPFPCLPFPFSPFSSP